MADIVDPNAEENFKKGFAVEPVEEGTTPPSAILPPNEQDVINMFMRKVDAQEPISTKETSKIIELFSSMNNENSLDQTPSQQIKRELGLPDKAPQPSTENKDYDYEGFVSKYGTPDQSKGQHLTDEFKLPNHPTFSNQSRYSNEFEKGGRWLQGGNSQYLFIPSDYNLKNKSPEELKQYFTEVENKGTFLLLPDGSLTEGGKGK